MPGKVILALNRIDGDVIGGPAVAFESKDAGTVKRQRISALDGLPVDWKGKV